MLKYMLNTIIKVLKFLHVFGSVSCFNANSAGVSHANIQGLHEIPDH